MSHAWHEDYWPVLHKLSTAEATMCGLSMDDPGWHPVHVRHHPHPCFTACTACADEEDLRSFPRVARQRGRGHLR